MGRVGHFTLLEDIFSYKSKERVGKYMPLKDITLRNGDPLKETKNIIEYKNNKHLRKSTGGPLKNK